MYARQVNCYLTLAFEFLGRRGLSPFFLLETLATRRTLRTAGIMLALTNQLLRHGGVLNVTGVRVSVAHATAADANVFDRVEVLQHARE